MNNKKTRNKIYHYIDCFFLLAPILLLVGFYIFLIFNSFTSGSNLKGIETTYFSLNDYWEYLDGIFEQYFTSHGSYPSGYSPSFMIDLFYFGGINDDSFFFDIILSLDNIFYFLVGEYDNSSFTYFLVRYFEYFICYEFLSLFINVVLWLPRYIRSWIQERGVNV